MHYLEQKSIENIFDMDNGTPRITMAFESDNGPGGVIESCIWFYKNYAEVRTYYSDIGSRICSSSNYCDELFRLLNFINSRVFLTQTDMSSGIYEARNIYMPRIYVTEDGNNITATTMINYELWDRVYQTSAYITGYCPDLMNMIAPFIFRVLNGQMTVDEAIEDIKKDIFDEK